MVPQKQSEEAIVPGAMNEPDGEDREEAERDVDHSMLNFKSFLWHGGSVYDAWFSCASNQVLFLFFLIL